MRFIWENGEVYCRCTITPKVRINTLTWGGEAKPLWVDSVGYIRVGRDGYGGHIYGTVSKEPPKTFATMEAAKAYVEEQSLIGLAVNRLGV